MMMLRLAIDYAQQELGAQKITLGVFCDNLSAVEFGLFLRNYEKS